MDELTLLRATRSEIAEPTLDELTPAFAQLERRMTRATTRRTRHRRVVGGIAALALATFAVGQTTVAVQASELSTVLNAAADETIKTVDPVVGVGQYLLVRTDAHWRTSTEEGTWLAPQTIEVYSPYDPSTDWVLERSWGKPDTFFNGSEAAAMAYWTGLEEPPYELIHARDGNFYGSPWQTFDMDDLPRDPQALLDYFDDQYTGGSMSRDEDNWERMESLLVFGSVPADLRAAVYKAIVKIPGVTVGDRAVTMDGRTGIAIGRTELLRLGLRDELIIDPETGLLIGTREVSTLPAFGFAAGQVIGYTSVTTTVVDAAP